MLRNFLLNKLAKFAVFLLAYFSVSQNLHGQAVDSHAVYWIKYQSQLNFSPVIWWTNEIDNRRFISPGTQNQFITHSRFHFKNGRWEYAAGLTLSWAYATFAEKNIQHPSTEIRPVIEASYEIPFQKWFLQQRLRIDNRFLEEDRFGSVLQDSYYIMRLRYRVQARIPLIKDENNQAKLVGKVAEEIMLNHHRNTFDQNRIYGTVEYSVSKRWAIETGYIYIYQQRLGRDELLSRHVIRFSLLHRIYFY
jgi:hypothetical protein